jgi:putative spermidine/putrescine transport system substrate-binding protein
VTRPSHPFRIAGALAICVALAAAACSAPGSKKSSKPKPGASLPAKPSHPVALNILDVAGNLQLTQGMIDEFVKSHSDIVSGVTYSKGTAPELAGKIKAQEDAGQIQINLVLTGTDGLSAGLKQGLWQKISPDYDAKVGNPQDKYLDPAAKMQQLAQGHGVEVVYYPSGPLLEYNPSKVSSAPTSPQALLDWAKSHPGRFQYADPANSGPGRTFLMGLPYLLGDKDPKDPVHGWDKTWAYLKQLGQYIPYYASGTTETMKNLASGAVDMIATTTGWYINPKALGTVPNETKVGKYDNEHWVTDAQYAVIPKGVDTDTLVADLALIKWMLTPKQQAKAYDTGYFYPGPAIKGVTLKMAPAASQETIRKYGEPQFDSWIAKYPKDPSLPADKQVTAFDMWARQIGAGKKKS